MDVQDPKSIRLPIEWYIPENLTTRYATNILVQKFEHEFIVSFYEGYPPPIVGSAEEVAEQVSKLKSFRLECVARIVVADGRMPEFVQALQDILNKSISQNDQEKSERES